MRVRFAECRVSSLLVQHHRGKILMRIRLVLADFFFCSLGCFVRNKFWVVTVSGETDEACKRGKGTAVAVD